MLVLRDSGENTEGVLVPFELGEYKFKLRLRPYDGEAIDAIRTKHSKKIQGQHPVSKQLVHFTTHDDDKIFDATIDMLIIGFESVVDEKGEPLKPTLKNKKRLALHEVTPGVPLFKDITAKAKEIATYNNEQIEALEKN